MTANAVPAAMVAAICLYVSVYYFIVYLKNRRETVNLLFAVTCFTIFLYDIFCAGLYNAKNLAEGIFWQRLQFAGIALFIVSVAWFVRSYTGRSSRRWEILVTVSFALFIVLGLTLEGPAALTPAIPSTKVLTGPLFGTIRYYEGSPGILYHLQNGATLVTSIYILFNLTTYCLDEDGRHARPMVISMFIFFISCVNDALVGAGVYTFMYILEYAYLLIIITMSVALLNQLVKLKDEVDELNIILEDKISERTRELFFSEMARELYDEAVKTGNEAKAGDAARDSSAVSTELTSLDKLGRDLSVVSHITDLVNTAAQKILRLARAESSYIFLYNDKGQLEMMGSARSPSVNIVSYYFPIVEESWRRKEYLIYTEEEKNGECYGGADIGRNILALPIPLHKEIIGICYLERTAEESSYTETDAGRISVFVRQTALLLENAFLYQRMINRMSRRERVKISPVIEKKLQKAVLYIENNFTSDIAREGLAAMLNLHPDSLSRYFKTCTGMKINDYINRLRVESASRKLADTGDPIIDIAFSSGFESLATFNRSFHRVMKMTPSEYRRDKKQGTSKK